MLSQQSMQCSNPFRQWDEENDGKWPEHLLDSPAFIGVAFIDTQNVRHLAMKLYLILWTVVIFARRMAVTFARWTGVS